MHRHLFVRTARPITWCLVALFLAVAPARAQGEHEDWSRNLGMYEINIRNFTSEGTFTAAQAHLDRLAELGVGIIWLMPIHPIGAENRLGSVGSPYSVRNYLQVNPAYGTPADLQNFVGAAHERGMFVILDWVANHTSWDNVLTDEHPEWYVTDGGGDFIPPPGTNWSDVIELDFSEQGLRDFMIDAMNYWVTEVGVDGFRFDAVDFVPNDFWQEATAALKETRSDLFLLAEGPSAESHDAGFDGTHAWSFYGFGNGVAKRIADGRSNAAAMGNFVLQEYATYPDDAYRLYFTSNHDENAWHGTPSELFDDGADVFAVLTATLDGLPLIYMGQEAGLDRRLAFFDRDPISWQPHENEAFYRTLLDLKRRNAALWSGSAGGDIEWIRTSDDASVFAFRREAAGDRVVVLTNLSDGQRTVTFDASAFAGMYTDVFADEAIDLPSEAEITLQPWSWLVLEKSDEGTSTREAYGSDGFRLEGIHPNPSRTRVSVMYTLGAPTDVRISVYDVAGRRQRDYTESWRTPGRHHSDVEVSGLPAGMYFVRLDAGTWTDHTRMTVVH